MTAKTADLPKYKPQQAASARDKLIKEFLDKNKGKQFDVDCAAFDQAIADLGSQSADKIDRIRFLGLLLQMQEPQPRYAETLVLANYLLNWPPPLMTPSL